jgi:hypothetical protein
MPESEQANTRVLPPIVWGEGYAQPCLTGCGNVLALDRLEDGDIWACAKCRAMHEFYSAYVSGPGGRIKYGLCRLLVGAHIRRPGEPDITEFVE